ncbi:hypothetical protein D3C71_2054110 [compost metagenome]
MADRPTAAKKASSRPGFILTSNSSRKSLKLPNSAMLAANSNPPVTGSGML